MICTTLKCKQNNNQSKLLEEIENYNNIFEKA